MKAKDKASKAYNSRPGKAARKWTVGSAKRAWGVGWPTLAATASGVRATIGKRGWREVLKSMRASWVKGRAKWAKDSKHGKAAEAARKAAEIAVPADTVNEPTTLVGLTPAATAGGSTGGGDSMQTARFVEAAAEMLGAAMAYQPEGMMQVGNDFNKMPDAFRNIANAMKTMATRATDQDPIHPAILDQMQTVYQHLQAAAMAAEELGPAFKNLHAVDIQRITNGRRNEQKWDVGANQDYVGQG